MANLSLTIKKEKGRELGTTDGVELTDEIYNSMSYSNQLHIGLHEKFIGPVTQVGEFQGRYYVLRDTLEAIAKLMKLV